MTIGIQNFYFPLPRYGVPLKDQWDEFRENFNSLASIVRAAEVDVSNSPGQSDLSYIDVGELDFRNRFRIGYDKSNDRFVIEYNNGSEISPNWVPYFAIRQGDGRVIALGSGGFQADGGFYNFSTAGFYLWVRPTVGRRYTFDQGQAGVVFDSQYFYLSTLSNSEEVLVSLTPAGVSGEVNTASNVGAGNGVFAQKSGVDLQFKSLVAGSNVTLTPTATQITISASASASSTTPQFYGINVGETDGTPVYPRIQNLKFESSNFYITQNNDSDTAIVSFRGTSSGGSGETNTASNLGAGSGVFAQKVGVDLQFKSIVAGTGITVTPAATQITISASGSSTTNSGFYGINIGETDGSPIYRGINTLKFDNSSFYVTQNDTDTAIVAFRGTSSGGGSGEANTASNVGSGTGVFKTKSGVDLQFKSLVAGTNISFTNNTNDITINVPDSSSPGFYGIVFRESRPGSRRERDDTLVFDSTWFYLTQAGDDRKPFLSFIPSSNGEANTASNLGIGEGVFAQKSGVDLQFKSLVAGTGITLTPTANQITVAATGGGGGSITFAESESGGYSKAASTLKFDSSDFYLTSGGDGNPIVSTHPGKKLLASYFPVNATSVDITNVITKKYDTYEIFLRLKPQTDDVELWIQTSTTNGVSFDTTNGDYGYNTIYYVAAGVGATLRGEDSAAAMKMGGSAQFHSVGNAANEFISGNLNFFNINDDANYQPTFTWNMQYKHTAASLSTSVGNGARLANTTPNAIRIMFESGNIVSGLVRVYGMAK